jgi:hypothetical protein
MTIREIKRNIKGVFKLPVKEYYLGKIVHGGPYFSPWNFNGTILTIRDKRPQFLRCKHFKLFGKEISYGWPIKIHKYNLGWKDKFDSPRFEWAPSFQIWFFKWQFCMWWIAPDKDNDSYYEQVLWYLKYSQKDIVKAINTWDWTNEKGLSTWKKEYQIHPNDTVFQI